MGAATTASGEPGLRQPALPAGTVVLAAHPDDDVLGAGVLLSRTRAGAVIHLTDGAPQERRLWPAGLHGPRTAYAALRRDEAERALALAGVLRSRHFCLGARDQQGARSLVWAIPRLAALLAHLGPAALVVHPLEGGHPDHDAAAIAGRAACALLARAGERPPRLLELASYHAEGGAPVFGKFLGRGEVRVAVPSAAELELKRRMLACHASQAAVLAGLPAGPEPLRRAPALDAAARPHAGPLWYELAGWARHREWRDQVLWALQKLRLAAAFPAEREWP